MRMRPNYTRVHPEFRLNGVSLSFRDLDEVSYSLIKEGEPFEQTVGQFLLDWIDGDATVQVKTSGSTGAPKIISLEKQHMMNSALTTGDYFGLQAGNSALLCLSAEHIAGKMMLVRAMALGLNLDFIAPSPDPLRNMEKTYDFCAMVPLQAESSLKQLDQIETLIIGGAPIPYQLRGKLQNVKSKVYETYGMTETITHIAVKKISLDTDSNKARDVFTLLPDIYIEKDARDCLVVKAPNISADTIVTNDMVDIVSETRFKWLGRFDNVVNSGGIKLFPEQIEVKLEPVLDSRFFVAGMADKKWGQKLVLVIENGTKMPEILEKVKTVKELEKYEVPKEVLFVSKFLETDNGKILRKETLLQMFNRKEFLDTLRRGFL